MSFYNELRDVLTPTTGGSWETVDLYGFGVPASAVVEIVCQHFNDAATRSMGIRSIGSSDERRLTLSRREATGGGAEDFVLHVRTDPNSRIQTYTSSTSNANFLLMGYWDAGEYVDTFNSFVPLSGGAWELATLSVPGEGLSEIVITNDSTSSAQTLGVRQVGSALERKLIIRRAISSGDQSTTLIVKTDTNNNVEVFTGATGNVTFYEMGHWKIPPGVFIEKIESLTGPISPSTWEDEDLSGFGVPNNSVAEIALKNDENTDDNTLGARQDGSSLSRIAAQGASDGTGADSVNFHVPLSGTQIIELNTTDVANTSFDLLGYWTPLSTANIGFFIAGIPSGSLDLYMKGAFLSSSGVDLFMSGKPSGNLTLFIDGQGESGAMDLFIRNNAWTMDLFLRNNAASLDLVLPTHSTFPLFAKVDSQDTTNSINFLIFGGAAGTQFSNNNLDLFLLGNQDTEPTFSGGTIFTKVGDHPLVAGTIQWPMFVKASNKIDNCFTLYMNAGVNINRQMNLFTQQDDSDLFSIGFGVESGSTDGFVKVQTGGVNDFPLFIEGFVFPTGTLNLSMTGSVGTPTGEMNLFMQGFFQAASGDLTLFMSKPTDNVSEQRTLYIRGAGC